MINNPEHPGSGDEPQRFLEIDTGGRKKRIVGTVSYLLFFLSVAVALVALFIYFTNQWTLAILLVGFMVIYMAFMGFLAMRKVEDRDDLTMR